MSVGDEMHDYFSEMEVYGPYTKDDAVRLENSLNERFKNGEEEHLEAVAAPLDSRSVGQILRDYRKSGAE
jgi:hypothetical protein